MKTGNWIASTGLTAVLALGGGLMVGCDDKPDTAGEALEKAGDKAGDNIEKAGDKAGRNIDKAANKVDKAMD